jgi:hypothetical protein
MNTASGVASAETFLVSLPQRYPVLWESLNPYFAALAKVFIDLTAPRHVLAFMHIPPFAQFHSLRGKHGSRRRALVKDLQKSMLDSAVELSHKARELDKLTGPVRQARLFDALTSASSAAEEEERSESEGLFVDVERPPPIQGDSAVATAPERHRLHVWTGALPLIDVIRRCEVAAARASKDRNAVDASVREAISAMFQLDDI